VVNLAAEEYTTVTGLQGYRLYLNSKEIIRYYCDEDSERWVLIFLDHSPMQYFRSERRLKDAVKQYLAHPKRPWNQ
jgi:hypothetical protein